MPDFSVTIGVCTYQNLKTRAAVGLWNLRDCPNPKITILPLDGDALISRSRSIVATEFLQHSKDDVLMFLDEDVSISSIDATKLMWEAWQMKLPIVGAAYVTKSKKNPGFAIRPLNEEEIEFGVNGKLYEMCSISTGCMAIRREVLDKFVSSKTAPLCSHGNIKYYPFFQHEKMIIDGEWEDISEDWYFCEKARKLGFKIWCDTTMKLGHIGHYEYNWDDVLEVRNEVRKNYDGGKFKFSLHNKGGILDKMGTILSDKLGKIFVNNPAKAEAIQA